MGRRVVIAGLAVLGLAGGSLPAGELFYDYAEVTAVEPLTDRVPGAAPPGQCDLSTDTRAPGTEGPGVAGEGIGSMVGGLREQLDAISRQEQCRQYAEGAAVVVGYRVTYRYGGAEYIRILQTDPGATMKVRVRLDPGM